MADIDKQASGSDARYPRDTARFIDISGTDRVGRPKAQVVLSHRERYADGTDVEVQTLSFFKPIVNVFRHADYVNVYLDFGSTGDVDLRMAWDMLSNFSRPENSVSYLPEEVEAGVYTDEDGEHPVYFPVLDLVLSPFGRESEYYMFGVNPAFFTLAPNKLGGEACVLQLTFHQDSFQVCNGDVEIDYAAIYHEIEEDLKNEGLQPR